MPFQKGNRANPGGRKRAAISPVTATYVKNHYEQACRMVSQGGWESAKELFDAVMTILKFEHAEMYGKPKERVDFNVTGEMSVKVIIE